MTHHPIHPTLRHPLTHEPLRALGRFRGRWIWPVLGGDDSVEPDGGNTDDGDDAADGGGLDQDDLDRGLDEAAEDNDGDGKKPDFDAERAMSLIKKLRGEVAETKKAAKADRTAAQEAATKAAQDAQAEMAQKLGLALGLIKPDDDSAKTADADALLKSIQAQVAEQATANNALRQELALRDAATEHGADLAELLDRQSFLNSLKGLDPTAQGYTARVSKAVADAIEKNPRLKKTAKASVGKSGAEITGQPPRKRERPKSLYEAVSRQMSGPA